MTDDVETLLRAVVALLPGGVLRDGQQRMASAVADSLDSGSHLLVQAGTGTGKSLAYLVPAVASGRRVVVSTATKALQEQLVGKDLPWLADAMRAVGGRPFTYALLKGRGNYLCRLRAATSGDDAQLAFATSGSVIDEIARLITWADETASGDRTEVTPAVSDRAWNAVSVSPGECPGASRCPHGSGCFAERARGQAAAADVVVVNHHLLAFHLATGQVLPEYDLVIVDEAHELDDVVTSAWGVDLGPPALDRLRRRAEPELSADLRAQFDDAIGDFAAVAAAMPSGRVLEPGPLGEAAVALGAALRSAIGAVELKRAEADDVTDPDRVTSLLTLLGGLSAVLDGLQRVLALDDSDVVWVEGGMRSSDTHVRVAPLDVGERLAEALFAQTTVVATSATLAIGGSFALIAARLGLGPVPSAGDPEPAWRGLDVGSPFDYPRQAMLYTPRRLPSPVGGGAAEHAKAVWEELAALMAAAGGRTLGLFTSMAAVRAAAEALAPKLEVALHVQGDAPPSVLVRAFADDERSCLLGTTSFWQGVDVPGPACTVVAIDRLPFPRPDDPLAVARRDAADAAGGNGFAEVYLAQAALLLAQGVGRLIRSAEDRGVVAILDPRICTARYAPVLVASLPPMSRWYEREPVEAALGRLAAARAPAG